MLSGVNKNKIKQIKLVIQSFRFTKYDIFQKPLVIVFVAWSPPVFYSKFVGKSNLGLHSEI